MCFLENHTEYSYWFKIKHSLKIQIFSNSILVKSLEEVIPLGQKLHEWFKRIEEGSATWDDCWENRIFFEVKGNIFELNKSSGVSTLW